MSKMKLLLDVVSDLRSLADSLQAVADAVAQGGQEQMDQTTEEKPVQKPEKRTTAKKEEPPTEKAGQQSKPLTLEQVRAALAEKSDVYKRQDILGVTIDTLRNWELNGLFTIKRTENRYRVYTEEDMLRLKIIRSLRCANYSLSAILRMLQALSDDPQTNIQIAINTPKDDDDIIRACDKLLTSLNEAKNNAFYVTCQIEKMKKISE